MSGTSRSWRPICAVAVPLAVSVGLAVAAPSSLAVGSLASPDPSATTMSFLPEADARVEEALPSANFGMSTRLGSDGDAGSRTESALRFDLSGMTSSVVRAELWLYVINDPTVDGPTAYPASNDWTEESVTWDTRPQPTGPALSSMGAMAANGWVKLDVTPLIVANGPVTVALRQSGTDGVIFYSRQGAYSPQLVVTAANPTVAAAGDIACPPSSTATAIACRQPMTADLVTRQSPTAVLALGDEQYQDGVYADFMGAGAYDATWGAFKSITYPVPGNHEYNAPGGAGYFQYFGAAAGKPGQGFYSYDLGAWHLVALNGEISVASGSIQEQWLRADLAGTTKPCILAYWHEPRFSSGYHGSTVWPTPLWNALYEARADVVLNGHDHDYERFAPQTPAGVADPAGIREFVVGTGGAEHEPMRATAAPNSEVRNGDTFGILTMTLGPQGYTWRFVPDLGSGGFVDSGSGSCHDAPPRASLVVRPSVGSAPLTVSADAGGSTDDDRTAIASYTFDFGDGSGAAGPQAAATAAHTYALPGTYTVTVEVADRAGLSERTTAQIVVRNGGFEVGTAGWNSSGSGPGIALTRVLGGHTGAWAGRLWNIGAAPSTCTLNDSPNWVSTATAAEYTATLWARAPVPGAVMKLRLREWAGASLAGRALTLAPLTTDWQPVTVTYTPVSPGATTLDLNAYVVDAPPGPCLDVDDIAVTTG